MNILAVALFVGGFFVGSNVVLSETYDHGSLKGTSRPAATQEGKSSNGYVQGRWLEGSFQYQDRKGNWKAATSAYRADKNGTYLNAQGTVIDYEKGDILFKSAESGWFKAKKESPVVAEEQDPAVPNPQGVELSETERLMVRFTNLERMKRGLAPLKVSPQLQNLTEKKAANMAKSHNLNHSISPQTPGGENIAWNQASARDVVNSWMNSDGHRANILNRNYTTIGVGVAQGNGPYWAQMFQ